MHPENIIEHPGLLKFPKIFRGLEPGIHKVVFADYPDKVYYFNLYEKLGPETVITISNLEYATYVTGIGVYQLRLYEEVEPEDYTIAENTLNHYLDLIALNGNTEITYEDGYTEQSIDHPATFSSVNSITMSTCNADDTSEIESRTFKLRHELKSLPCGIKDFYVLDAEHQQSYILYKLGYYSITGVEDIQYIDTFSNNDYATFFIPFQGVVKTGEDDKLLCNYFKTYKADILRSKDFSSEGICISYDEWRGRGFYIKIKRTRVDTLSDFKTLVNTKFFRNHNLEVIYELNEEYLAKVLLDEYHISTYYNKTKIELQNPAIIPTYFYKSSLT